MQNLLNMLRINELEATGVQEEDSQICPRTQSTPCALLFQQEQNRIIQLERA